MATQADLFAALVAISDNCNHATDYDNVGFSKVDTEFGHWVAKQIKDGKTLSEKQFNSVKKLIHKYRRQVAIFGFNPEELSTVQYVRPVNNTVARFFALPTTTFIKKETEKALLLTIPNFGDNWFPKSCHRLENNIHEVYYGMARDKGLTA